MEAAVQHLRCPRHPPPGGRDEGRTGRHRRCVRRRQPDSSAAVDPPHRPPPGRRHRDAIFARSWHCAMTAATLNLEPPCRRHMRGASDYSSRGKAGTSADVARFNPEGSLRRGDHRPVVQARLGVARLWENDNCQMPNPAQLHAGGHRSSQAISGSDT